jgi:hypothetical protein
MIRAILTTVTLVLLATDAAQAAPSWKSGSNGSGAGSFASWRGSPLGLAVGWAPFDNWTSMLNYMSSSNPRKLKSLSSNVSIGLGLFPRPGGNPADCAANRYATNHRTIGSRLTANGVGNAELRLGWEASNDSYPWTAVGKPADQWKTCFTNAAKAIKSGGPGLRISWHMAKKGKINVNTIWPSGAPITTVGVSHYDDAQARFGNETANGSPWGLRAWLAFAKSKGKQLQLSEWGGGRAGDNPGYIDDMHAFFRDAGGSLAHEGYLNSREHQLYSTTRIPKTSARYRELF